MKKSMKLMLTLSAVVLVILLAPEARADTVVITGGGGSVTGLTGGLVFSFTGPGFSASNTGAETGNVSAQGCLACQPGTTISLSGRFSGESALGYGPVTFNGTTYADVFYAGTLQFDSLSFVLPPLSPSVLTFTAPFQLSGRLDGYPTQFFNTPPLFGVQVAGGGIATMEFTRNPDGSYAFRSLRYDFQQESIPEPATLILLGTGLSGSIAMARRRRRNRSR